METIVEQVMQILPNQKPVIIGISGISGSGYEEQARYLQGELVKQGLLVHFEQLLEEEVEMDPENPAKSWYEQAMPVQKAKAAIEKAKQHREWDIVLASGPFLLKNTVNELFHTSIWVDCSRQTAKEREKAAQQKNIEWRMGAHHIHTIIDEPKQKADLVMINDPRLQEGPQTIQQGFIGGKWMHEPSSWNIKNERMTVSAEGVTDFWQKTHYGFQNDNGHFYYMETDLDFVMTVTVEGNPQHQFDQAGLMVRLDENNWLKTSLEHELHHLPKLGAVVTNFGFSDWSTQELMDAPSELQYKITRTGQDYLVEVWLKDRWQQLRVARLQKPHEKVMCGIYCCSPIKNGFIAEFSGFRIEENV
ncbi:DUF1349 domain-containing protein [Bacillus sp. FJAT-42376]|uniref:DUF1349 domain-containing protein n=1 Tax=Bacillus sp. FJAT-42376 TaxID=2014076 RepID=UPI000F50BCDF|nr:DUF1349 domain-containing protein [Bacillus sp. FJAT-42376]AZB42670.1 DUF1349 domain-containing protein [Bacillus sp. FJAT-42376]